MGKARTRPARRSGPGAFLGRRSRIASRAGTSLVEVLVATMLFLLAVLGVFGHLTYGRIQVNLEMRRRYAAEAAHSRLEVLRTAPYDGLHAYAEEQTPVDLDGIVGSRTTVVDDVDEDGDGATDYRSLAVTITWPENGTDHELRLVTLRSGLR